MTSSIDFELNSLIIEDVSKSVILRATVSDKIINNNVIVSVVGVKDNTISDYDVITEEELSAFLTAITDGFGMSNVDLTSFTASDLKLPEKDDEDLDDKLNILAASVLMRATITSKMELKNSSTSIDYEIKAISSDVQTMLQFDILLGGAPIIKADELVKTMKAIVYLTDGGTVTAELDINTLANLSESDLNVILSSNIFRIVTDEIIYQFASTNAIALGLYNAKVKEAVELFSISAMTTSNKEILTKADEITLLVAIRALL